MEREYGHNPEYREIQPSIRLEFFRHDEKTKLIEDADNTDDSKVRLTERGRVKATAKGQLKNPHAEVAVSFGSGRERSQETALRHMLAEELSVTPDMSLEDMREEVGRSVSFGKKDAVTGNLDFDWDSNEQFHDAAYERYLDSKDALKFIWKDSDGLVKELKDDTSSSYSRLAGNVAELVFKYITIFPRWKNLANEKPEKYKAFDNEMQRFFSSHQGVLESFLMKVMEKNEGAKGVENFINSLADKNGFGFSEGFSVEILEQNGETVVHIQYKDKKWFVSPNMIQEIVQERDLLNKEIKVSLSI